VVEVPAQAVTTTNSGSTVQVSTDGTTDNTETRTVKTGLTSGGEVQITSGLAAGEQVVVTRGGPPAGFGGQTTGGQTTGGQTTGGQTTGGNAPTGNGQTGNAPTFSSGGGAK
jgi:hypothetical protein